MKTPEAFLPDFCSLTTAFVLILGSLLLAFVLALADFSPRYDFLTEVGLRGLFIAWIAWLSAALLCAMRRWLEAWRAFRAGAAAFATVLLVTLAVGGAAQAGLARIGYPEGTGLEPWAFYGRILAISALVTLAWLRHQYVQSRWRSQIRAESIARLDALQARVQPHFLFNSLNTIASLIRKEPATAEELLLDLAEVFRAILKKTGKLVPLSEEIALTRQYLGIEQYRLGPRLKVAWDMRQAPGDALLPPLSLQPLVENAIRYGIEPALNGGKIEIQGRLARGSLVLSILNSLPEEVVRRSRPGNGVALENLQARLESCFPNRARLYTSQADGRYQVRIVIPYQGAGHENPPR